MADKWTFKLGTIELFDFEVPESLPLGGDQGHAVHNYVGGGRDVQAFGFHRRPIAWTGTLYPVTVNGQPKSPQDRSVEFEKMVAAGQPVDFIYGGGTTSVLIAHYHPTVRHINQIDYEIELIVVDDKGGAPLKAPSLDTTAMAGLLAANAAFTKGWSLQFPPSGLLTLFTLLLSQVNAAFPWSQSDPVTLNNLIASAQSLATQLDTFAGGFAASPKGVDDLNAFIAAAEAAGGVRVFAACLQAIQQPNAQPVYVSNTNVFDLAARAFGAVQTGLDLMALNGLPDPRVTTPIPFTTPAVAPPSSLPAPGLLGTLLG